MTIETPDDRDPDAHRRTREADHRSLADLLSSDAANRTAVASGQIMRPVELEPLIAVAKRLRNEFAWHASCFGRMQFFEPAWDLMLHIFIAQESGESVDLGEACRLLAMERSAGARWIGALEARGLVDVGDVRASDDTLLKLSKRGRATMTDYLSALR